MTTQPTPDARRLLDLHDRDMARVSAVLDTVCAERDELRDENERLRESTFPKTWAGFRAFLDEQYPEDVFPDNGRDLGPAFVVAARRLAAVERERDELHAENRWVWDRLDREMELRCAVEERLEAVEVECDRLDRVAGRDRFDTITGRTVTKIVALIRAALSPAPQPERCEHGKTKAHPTGGYSTGRWSDPQHCPGPASRAEPETCSHGHDGTHYIVGTDGGICIGPIAVQHHGWMMNE